MDHGSAAPPAGQGDVLRAQGIDAIGKLGVPLTAIHIGHGGSMDDDIRPEGAHGVDDSRRIADIHLGQIQAQQLILSQDLPQRLAQLTLVAGDQDAHAILLAVLGLLRPAALAIRASMPAAR